jgi:hypothetical protein
MHDVQNKKQQERSINFFNIKIRKCIDSAEAAEMAY